MIEKEVKDKDFYIFFIFYLFAILIVITFLSLYFYTNQVYKVVLLKEKDLDSKTYYKDLISLLDKALYFYKYNPDLYSKKADYLYKIDKDNIDIIEKLYIKAIRLNPINYEYHFKLGLFYFENKKIDLAEKELYKAYTLYPLDYQVNLYLIKGYLKNNKIFEAFKNLILFLEFTKNINILKDIKEDIKNTLEILIDWDKRFIKYVFYHIYIFDFKEQDFPNITSLKIIVYTKEPTSVILYRNNKFYCNFKKIDKIDNYYIYELNLNIPKKLNINEFGVKTEDFVSIEKLEILKEF